MHKLLPLTLGLLLACTSPSDKKVEAVLAVAQEENPQEQLKRALEYDKKGQYEEAAIWYRKAAEQGLSVAQNNLGVMYKDGQGVRADTDSARYWFELAAQHNLPQAQHNLEQLK